jgi:ADP-heptose:LPS heptosyltransferase
MNIESPVKILVQRRAAIGDVIMSTGVVRELRKRYGPEAQIDVATEFLEPYRNNPHVSNLIPMSALPTDIARHWDIYINLDNAYETNPINHYVDTYFHRVFGDWLGLDQNVELYPDSDDRDIVDQDLAQIGDKFIVVHMRNWHWGAKNIQPDVWFQVFEQLFLARSDFKIVCAGGPTDLMIADHPLFYDVRTRYNSQQLKLLCDSAACFVGIDSGPFQCAAASNTHIIALLTHLHPDRILPYRSGIQGHECTVIQTSEDCRGCNDQQARPVSQLVCHKRTYPCVSNFDTEAIANAILEQL